MNGGYIRGWAVQKQYAEDIKELFYSYQESVESESLENNLNSMVLAVGDGNHSLATAKSCWEDLKKKLPQEQLNSHPARYAMV